MAYFCFLSLNLNVSESPFFLNGSFKRGGKKTSAKAKGSEGLNIQSNDSNLNQLNRKLGIVRRCAPPRAWGWRRGHGSTKG